MLSSRDARLVARVRRGDSSAFEALHARHQPAVLSFCRHLTGNREDAEDAVQHTFLAAYRRIVDSADELELRPWLFTVARNRSLSLLRARRERVVADPDSLVFPLDGLAAEVERREELRDLVRDMAGLPEPQRAALVLSQLDALSYRQIGTVLEVTPEKVKSLVFQARSSLASTREAREAPCFEIRSEIANARGSGLRRRLLRRHVGQCDGCREFEVTVTRQRRDLQVLLPVVPSAGLGQAVLGAALGRDGASAGVGGGAVTAAAGGAGGGVAGTIATLGVGGAAKLALVAAVAGGGTAGAFAADLPQRVREAVPGGGRNGSEVESHAGAPASGPDGGYDGPRSSPDGGESGKGGRPGSDEQPGSGEHGASEPVNGREPVGQGAKAGLIPSGDAGEGAASDGTADDGQGAGGGDGGNSDSPGLPPGLAKRDDLPPGLAKRDDLPPGLAKREPGARGRPGGSPPHGNGHGPAGAPGRTVGRDDGGNPGAGPADPGGAPGNGAGQGNSGAGPPGGNVGQGNGNGGGQGANGNGGGGGQGHAPAGAPANPGGSGVGNGNGGGQGNAGGGQPGRNGNAGANGNGGGKPN